MVSALSLDNEILKEVLDIPNKINECWSLDYMSDALALPHMDQLTLAQSQHLDFD